MEALSRPPLRPSGPGLLALLLALLAGPSLLSGCDVFRPAVPETGGASTFINFNSTDPESVLKYLALGIEDKARSNGLDSYTSGMADSAPAGTDPRGFHAFFDANVLILYHRQAPEDWDLDLERTFYQSFIQVRPEAYQVQLQKDVRNPDTYSTDRTSAVLHRKYQVFAVSEQQGAYRIAVGYADLYFVKFPSGRWAITRWDDHVDDRDPNVGVRPQNADDLSFSARRLNAAGG